MSVSSFTKVILNLKARQPPLERNDITEKKSVKGHHRAFIPFYFCKELMLQSVYYLCNITEVILRAVIFEIYSGNIYNKSMHGNGSRKKG